MKKIKYFEKH
ncbi:Protein of unknown function [Leuconostoc citreum]|nr:Protein of unknown function [Leuconostoc citreum]